MTGVVARPDADLMISTKELRQDIKTAIKQWVADRSAGEIAAPDPGRALNELSPMAQGATRGSKRKAEKTPDPDDPNTDFAASVGCTSDDTDASPSQSNKKTRTK